MHMADALLSPAVGLAADAISVAAIGISVARVKKDEFSEKKVPIIGVAGALVFAAQMINFTIPGTGSSGHIGGGILLAGLLGGVPAFLSITAVLIIQCLFFADGGLLALGCNVINLGVIPCLLVYPLVFRPLIKSSPADYKRLSAASVISAIIALELGAFCVVLQTWLSGISQLPFGTFTALMLPIHLVIGLVEGVVTAAVLCFVYKMQPEIISSTLSDSASDSASGCAPNAVSGSASGSASTTASGSASTTASTTVSGSASDTASTTVSGSASAGKLSGVSFKKTLITLAVLAVAAGGVLTLAASTKPDGLEWAIGKAAEKSTAAGIGAEADSVIKNGGSIHNTAETGTETGATTAIVADSNIHNAAAEIQEATAILPDYTFASNPENAAGKPVSGIIGAAVSFAAAGGAGLLISIVKRRKRAEVSADA